MKMPSKEGTGVESGWLTFIWASVSLLHSAGDHRWILLSTNLALSDSAWNGNSQRPVKFVWRIVSDTYCSWWGFFNSCYFCIVFFNSLNWWNCSWMRRTEYQVCLRWTAIGNFWVCLWILLLLPHPLPISSETKWWKSNDVCVCLHILWFLDSLIFWFSFGILYRMW